MTTRIAHLPRPLKGRIAAITLAVSGSAAALALGLAAGFPTPETASLAGLALGAAIVAFVTQRPFVAYTAIAASVVMLIVVMVSSDSGLNLLDLLIPPVLLVGYFGATRQAARAGDATETGERHDAIRLARRRLSRAVVAYFGLAALSIVRMFFDGRADSGVASMLSLVRACEGLLLFPLGLWFLRSESRIRQTITAMCAAAVFLLAVNVPAKLLAGVKRAGMTWWVNDPMLPISDPNEAASGMLMVIALLVVLQRVRPRWSHLVLACAALVMLVLTFSRSGLLALIVFWLLVLRQVRFGPALTVALLLALALPLVPQEYWQRMKHTLLMKQGTFDTFGSMIRFITWSTAMNAFLHNPLFGVGYLGLESVSTAYNDLKISVGAESYVLEIAADLGIAGLIALGFVVVRMIQLGHAVRRVAGPGSLGYHMAALNTPILMGIMVANLTASSLVGMVGLGQLALWNVLMARAGHEAVKDGRHAPAAPGA